MNTIPSPDPGSQSAKSLQAANAIAQKLHDAGYQAFFVGGAVRDILIGRTPVDYDVTTNAKPEEITHIEGIAASPLQDAALGFGVSRVRVTDSDVLTHTDVELATFRKDIDAHKGRKNTKVEFASELHEDLVRRDLTINALAYNPLTEEFVDEVGGLEDLNQRQIRFIGNAEERIKEDPLRILRAIRFRNQLGFRYEEQSWYALCDGVDQNLLDHVSPERIQMELNRMLLSPHAQQAMIDLEQSGALAKLLPEAVAMIGVQQPRSQHTEGDVWQHTLLALRYLPEAASLRLAWGVLLHDIAKPLTYESVEQTGDRIRFDQHYKIGADMARKILKRLRFGKKFINDVAWMIDYHMSVNKLLDMSEGKRRTLLDHPAFGDLLELHRCDARAAWNMVRGGGSDTSEPDLEYLVRLYEQHEDAKKHPKPTLKNTLGIDGHWVQKELGINDGKEIGMILDQLEEAFDDGKLTSAAEATKLLSEKS